MFHRMFGEEPNVDLLISLLNDLLALPPERSIVQLTYLPATRAPRISRKKLSIVDVKCLDAAGVRYIVEMQVVNVDGFEKRMVYNLCKAYAGQLNTGKEYIELDDVVAVAICDFVLWPNHAAGDEPKVPMLSRWRMSEEATGAVGFRQLRYVVLELPKYQAGHAPVTPVDKWAYLFREAERLSAVPAALSQGAFAKALEVARVGGFTDQQWEDYDRAEMEEQDARGAVDLAVRIGRAEAKAEGIAAGIARSILQVLELRGLTVDERSRARILGCTDPAQLQAWLGRAVSAASAAGVVDS